MSLQILNLLKNLAIKLGLRSEKIKIINPGCNYPIKIIIILKNLLKKYMQCFPKLITISRLDGRKSHQNILMTIKNLLPKFPKLNIFLLEMEMKKLILKNLKKNLGLDKE